jgi:hypothetical protein
MVCRGFGTKKASTVVLNTEEAAAAQTRSVIEAPGLKKADTEILRLLATCRSWALDVFSFSGGPFAFLAERSARSIADMVVLLSLLRARSLRRLQGLDLGSPQ